MSNAIAKSGFTASQLQVIRQTVASDTDATEFNLFMEACRSYGLDPFRKQIFAVVYNKNKPEKRKMSIIVSRDGQRVIASRCHDYRPASEPAQIAYDKETAGPTNPKGILSATVRLWKQDNKGEWYPVIGEAYWDEFAPIADQWGEDANGKWKPTGKKALDASGQWAKMPIVMITKCAESQALRAGWPEQFGNIYAEEEMDKLKTEATASEALQEYETQERLKLVGGPGIMMVFDDAMKLEKIKVGEVFDRCDEFLQSATPEDAHVFRVRNEDALREFWGHDKGAALKLKEKFEAKEKQIAKTSEDAA